MDPLNRRHFSALTLAAAVSALVGASLPGEAVAQGITDEFKTRLLRDGVGAAAASSDAATRMMRKGIGQSRLPATELDVEAGRGGAAKVRIQPDRALDMDILFRLDSDELMPAALPGLAWLGQALAGPLAGRAFLLAGHTDITGPLDHNLDLSRRRALAVWRHLVETSQADGSRLYIAGFGPRYLRDPARPAAMLNRRVEIVAIAG